MENKKRQAVYLAVFAVCLGLMSWIWFGRPSTTPPPPVTPTVTADAQLVGSLLPFGTEFDLQVLSDSRFLELVAPEQLRISSEELGRTNPFSPP